MTYKQYFPGIVDYKCTALNMSLLDKRFYKIDVISASLIYFVDLHLDLFV